MNRYVFGVVAAVAISFPAWVVAADAAPVADGHAAEAKLVAPEVVEAMSKLVELGVQAASPALMKADDFEPYAVLQKKDGSLQIVRWQKPDTASATPPPAMEIFRRVTLTVLDVTSKDPDIVAASTFASSASTTADGKTMIPMIRAEVDHRDGTPMIVLIPFQRTADGKLEFGTTPSLPGTNFLFFRDKEGHTQLAPGAAAAKPATAAAPAKDKAKPKAAAK